MAHSARSVVLQFATLPAALFAGKLVRGIARDAEHPRLEAAVGMSLEAVLDHHSAMPNCSSWT